MSLDWRTGEGYTDLGARDARLWAWIWFRAGGNNGTTTWQTTPRWKWRSEDRAVHHLIGATLDQVFSRSGFVFKPSHGSTGGDVKVFWHPALDQSVVQATACPVPADHPDALDLTSAPHCVILMDRVGNEHVLIGAGAGQIQLNLVQGTCTKGPIKLTFDLDGLAHIEGKIRTIAKLIQWQRKGTITPAQPLSAKHNKTYVEALRALHGASVGACQRDLAAALYGERQVCAHWGQGTSFLRLRVQRRLQLARRMVCDGYKALLG